MDERKKIKIEKEDIKLSLENRVKLELLRELTNATLENGRTQWNNRSIISWIDKQKEKINGNC